MFSRNYRPQARDWTRSRTSTQRTKFRNRHPSPTGLLPVRLRQSVVAQLCNHSTQALPNPRFVPNPCRHSQPTRYRLLTDSNIPSYVLYFFFCIAAIEPPKPRSLNQIQNLPGPRSTVDPDLKQKFAKFNSPCVPLPPPPPNPDSNPDLPPTKNSLFSLATDTPDSRLRIKTYNIENRHRHPPPSSSQHEHRLTLPQPSQLQLSTLEFSLFPLILSSTPSTTPNPWFRRSPTSTAWTSVPQSLSHDARLRR